MIDFVQGTLVTLEEDSIIVNVGGLGYQIYVPRPENYQSMLNDSMIIYTHHYMREDWMGLFGFKEKEERQLFRLLISVSGIGPKSALAMMGNATPQRVIQAIITNDEKYLTKMPGVGKKTAQRIILDLKDKVKGLNINGASNDDLLQFNDQEDIGLLDQDLSKDLKEALKALGYHEQEIQRALYSLKDQLDAGIGLDQLIKLALQNLMKK